MRQVIKTALAGSSITLVSIAPAIGAVWDGGTPPSADASGNWSLNTNWDTDTLPGGADTVGLPSVSAGTRTVIQDLPSMTVSGLTLTQSNNLGTNAVTLAGDLALTTANGYVVTRSGGATVDKVQLNLSGRKLTIATAATGNSLTTLDGTINFNGAGSTIDITNSANTNSTINIIGTLNVSANGVLSRTNANPGSTTGNMIFNFGRTTAPTASATVNITAGTLQMGYVGRRTDTDAMSVNTAMASVVTIAPGAGLAVKFQATGDAGLNRVYVSTFSNAAAATVDQGGMISFQGTKIHADTAAAVTEFDTINNSGTWKINGSQATIKRLSTLNNAAIIVTPRFVNLADAALRGNTASDALEYEEQVETGGRVLLTNSGNLVPGAGTNQAGLSSVGSLALRDIDLTFTATGKLNLDVGGTGAGQFDALSLSAGLNGFAGAGVLDLAATGDRLNITLVNSFVAGNTSFSIPILHYGSAVLAAGVGFDVLSINGLTTNAPTYDNGIGIFSIQYNATSANLVYAVPEPASLGLLMIGAAALLRRRG